jgi:hypothetical protein
MGGMRFFALHRTLLVLALPLLATLGGCASQEDEDLDDENPDNAGETDDALKKCGSNLKWKLHMREEFDAWDDARWTKFDQLAVPNSKTCAVASNVGVANGMLRIDTKNEAGCGGMPYTGGAVHSYAKFWTGKYFKAVIRAKVSQDTGIFGAPLWFRPGNATGPTGADGGEIDVAESLGAWKTPAFHVTLHADYASGANIHRKAAYQNLGDKQGTDFHTYVLQKTPNGVTVSVDQKWVAGWGCGHAKNEAAPKFFKQWIEETPDGWSIRIDNKVGGNWAGDPDKSTRWGSRTALFVDYIRVYRPE